QPDVFVSFKFRRDASDFIGLPNVVLVGQKNDVARSTQNRLLEIFRRTQVFFVYLNRNRKRRASGKIFQNRNGRIIRAIVADDNFVGQASLRGKPRKLFGQKSGAVISAKRN